jgi:hypothetical protein
MIERELIPVLRKDKKKDPLEISRAVSKKKLA